MKKEKTARQMERHLKGVANHHRINILFLVAGNKGISLEEIIDELKANEKTIGEHSRRLMQAGLINKKHNGRFVEHSLSPYGRIFVEFLKRIKKL